MERCGEAVLDHVGLFQVREGWVQFLEPCEVIKHRLDDLLDCISGNICG